MWSAISKTPTIPPNAMTDLGSISMPASASKYWTSPPCEEGSAPPSCFAMVNIHPESFKKVGRLETVVSPILFLRPHFTLPPSVKDGRRIARLARLLRATDLVSPFPLERQAFRRGAGSDAFSHVCRPSSFAGDVSFLRSMNGPLTGITRVPALFRSSRTTGIGACCTCSRRFSAGVGTFLPPGESSHAVSSSDTVMRKIFKSHAFSAVRQTRYTRVL